jgi:hypothetical protein
MCPQSLVILETITHPKTLYVPFSYTDESKLHGADIFVDIKGILQMALEVNELSPLISVYTGCVSVHYILRSSGSFTSVDIKKEYWWLCTNSICIYIKTERKLYCLSVRLNFKLSAQ